MQNKKYILLLPVLVLLYTACQRNNVYENYKSIDGEKWCRENVIEFETVLPDSGKYIVNLCLRHTTDYEMANLWSCLHTRLFAKELKDTINMKVAEPDGRWLGDGNTVKPSGNLWLKIRSFFPKGTLSSG